MALIDKLQVHLIFLDTIGACDLQYQFMYQKTVTNMFNYKWSTCIWNNLSYAKYTVKLIFHECW